MHMQTHSRHFKTCVFCFASPLQLRVVIVFLFLLYSVVRVCIHQPHRRIIQPLFVFVFVLLDGFCDRLWSFRFLAFNFRHDGNNNGYDGLVPEFNLKNLF